MNELSVTEVEVKIGPQVWMSKYIGFKRFMSLRYS